MNNVKIDTSNQFVTEPAIGDIYASDAGNLYILALVDYDNSYVAVCLSDGNRWAAAPTKYIENAVDGLKLHRRNANITITIA